MNTLINSIQLIDCTAGYRQIESESIDLILTDPPYGVTACKWDIKPDLALMWNEFNRIIKPNGAIVITATQPFATDVINANRKNFRYDLVWVKNAPVGFLNANRMPLRQHELILVFYKRLPKYHPQKVPGKRYVHKGGAQRTSVYNQVCKSSGESSERFPTSVMHFSKDSGKGKKHPTQKPKALFEWVIKSYTEKDAVVFDPYMGSGTTAVSALSTGRNFIGFEKELEYYEMAMSRIRAEKKAQTSLFVA